MSETISSKRFQVFSDKPILELNTQETFSYEAIDRADPHKASLFGLVCQLSPFPRIELFEKYQSIVHPHLLTLAGWQSIPWPDTYGNQSMCLIYHRPIEKRFCDLKADTFKTLSEEQLISCIEPLVEGLQLLHQNGIFHRNIRPDNLFLEDLGRLRIGLGDCLSMPPAYAQPAFIETVESMMCHPLGRGNGSARDDIYALGATLLALSYGQNPFAGLSLEEMIDRKIELGSYNALMSGRSYASFNLQEFFKGVLADDPRDQWTLGEILAWTKDNRKKAKIPHMSAKAIRPFTFKGKDYYSPQQLAFSAQNNWEEAKKALTEKSFEFWLTQEVRDTGSIRKYFEKQHAERKMAAARRSMLETDDNILLASLCSVMDPNGPIHWKGYAVMPDGIGFLLTDCVLKGEESKKIIHLLKNGTIFYNASSSEFSKAIHEKYKIFFDRLRYQLSIRVTSLASEKSVYFLNPFVPCLSPHLRKKYIYKREDILKGLNEILEKSPGSHGLDLLDAHVLSFLLVRFPELREADLGSFLFSGKDNQSLAKCHAILNLFSVIQASSPSILVPALTRWIYKMVHPITREYKNKYNRQEIEDAAHQAAEAGDIIRLRKILMDPTRLGRDLMGLRIARAQYRRLEAQIQYEYRTILKNERSCFQKSEYQAFYLSILLTFFCSTIGSVFYFSGHF